MEDEKKVRIVTFGKKYPQIRLVMGHLNSCLYKCIENWFNPVVKRLKGYEFTIPCLFDISNRNTIYHSINTILFTNRKWLCSFETMLPRGGDMININNDSKFSINTSWYKKMLMRTILRDNCLGIVAFSKCNYQLQLLVNSQFEDYAEQLNNKTHYIPVPQPKLIEQLSEKEIPKRVKFIFVGSDFVRKGGCEILSVFDEISEVRKDFQLTLITDVSKTWNYAFKKWPDSNEYTSTILEEVKDKDWVTIVQRLTQDEVYDLLRDSDVGLLPTWADSYGYSVLEMQASGVPVISTCVRALEETNSNGWVIKLPMNYTSELALTSEKHKEEIRYLLRKQLKEIVLNILDNPAQILDKRKASYEYVTKEHSIENYREKLQELYRINL